MGSCIELLMPSDPRVRPPGHKVERSNEGRKVEKSYDNLNVEWSYENADTPAQFEEMIQKSNRNLVDFHATWCGPCKKIAPYLVSECRKYGIHLIKVDADKNKETKKRYNIQGLPTLKVIDSNGTVIF